MNALSSEVKPTVAGTAAPKGTPTGHRNPRRAWVRVLALGGLAAVVLTGALVAGTVPRLRQEQVVNAQAAAVTTSLPRVTVAVTRPAEGDVERVLPGNSQPLLDAALYARTTGYVKTRHVDIGDHVEQGQLLAELTVPDVDAQLAQAQANLAQARANLPLSEANADLAKITLNRDLKAGPGIAISLEQIDQERAQVKTTTAQVEATRASIQVNEAAVQRFTVLQGFQKITAPFPGVITARNIDPGDLVTADSPSTNREMFHIMRTDVLRVFVNVPQVFATGIQVGQNAVVFQRDTPAKQFSGKVTRTADALDPNTRTLLTEVQVPNPDDALRAGMYLQVKFALHRVTPSIRIPAAAIVVRNGPRKVAVLDAQHIVHYKDVQLGRDFGDEIEVLTGLNAGETAVVHPGDDIPEGTAVEPVPLSK
jgi:RND family efflux transporter MFP subunit